MSLSKITKHFSQGFTLIELLVVVAVIGILTAMILPNLSESKSKARDGERIGDLAQIQVALALFFDRCNVYPATLSTSASCTLPGPVTVTFSTFINPIPTDPNGGGSYSYGVDNSTTPTDYVLRARLEGNNPALTDTISGTQYGVSCDHNAFDYCVLPR